MKKLLMPILILFCILSFTIPSYAITFGKYHNKRFNYIINYPAFLIPQSESANHDGRVFKNNDSELTVWGAYTKNGLDEIFNYANDDLKNFTIKTSIKKKDYFLLIGESDTQIAYFKTILVCSELISMRLYYPKADQSKWDPIVNVMEKSFKYAGKKCK